MYTPKQRFYEYEKNLELCSSLFFFKFWLADYFYEKMNKVGLLIIYTYTKTAESHFLMEI